MEIKPEIGVEIKSEFRVGLLIRAEIKARIREDSFSAPCTAFQTIDHSCFFSISRTCPTHRQLLVSLTYVYALNVCMHVFVYSAILLPRRRFACFRCFWITATAMHSCCSRPYQSSHTAKVFDAVSAIYRLIIQYLVEQCSQKVIICLSKLSQWLYRRGCLCYQCSVI